MTKTKRQGLTLIEVMLVLALSGILVVAALSTFRGRGSFLFQNNVRQVGESIRTVANETKSSLGPANYDTKYVADSGSYDHSKEKDPTLPAIISANPFTTNENIYGQAIELFPRCKGGDISTWCLVIHKLKTVDTDDSARVTAYERYPLEIPSNLIINFQSSTYDKVPISATTTPYLKDVIDVSNPTLPSTTKHLMIAIKNTDGRGYVFTRDAIDYDTSFTYLVNDITDKASYTEDRSGQLRLVLEDKNNSNAKGMIDIDLKNPTSVQVSFP